METAIADDDENRGEFRRQSEINVPKSVTSQRCEIGPIFGLGGPETAFFPLGFRLRPQKLRQCLHLAQKRRKGWMGLEAFPTGEEFHRASLSAERLEERNRGEVRCREGDRGNGWRVGGNGGGFVGRERAS